jgi:hypothetical protein
MRLIIRVLVVYRGSFSTAMSDFEQMLRVPNSTLLTAA